MSGKIKLGKTRDSRTRAKAKPAFAQAMAGEENAESVLLLPEELKKQTGFTNYLLMKGFSSATVKRFIKDTESFLVWAEKQNIETATASYADVLHFIQGKRETVKQKTISIQLNSLKHYFNFLATTGHSIDNPVSQIKIRGIKRKTLYDILKKSELESLYHHFSALDDNDPNRNRNWFKTAVMAGKRNKVIVGLMVYQGLTVHELAALTEKDIQLREGKIVIEGGRRSEARVLTLEAHQVLDIMEYQLKIRDQLLEQSKKQSDAFFISAGQSAHFRSIIQKLIAKLNLQNSNVTSAKQIRASVIVHWLKLYNLRQVQYMAGHRFVSSTEAYLVNDVDDLKEDIAKFHPIG